MRNKIRLTILLPVLLCANVMTVANAEPTRRYQVEVIVFERLNNNMQGNERFYADPLQANLLHATELTQKQDEDALVPDYQSLLTDELSLNHEEQRLRKNSNYRVLLHTGWRQSNDSDNKRVHLFSGLLFDTETSDTPDMSYQTQMPYAIDGVMRVKRRNYYIADLDLVIRIPASTLLSSADSSHYLGLDKNSRMGEFHIQSHRRMRLNELHYIDHPALGILVKVTPAEALPVETEETLAAFAFSDE